MITTIFIYIGALAIVVLIGLLLWKKGLIKKPSGKVVKWSLVITGIALLAFTICSIEGWQTAWGASVSWIKSLPWKSWLSWKVVMIALGVCLVLFLLKKGGSALQTTFGGLVTAGAIIAGLMWLYLDWTKDRPERKELSAHYLFRENGGPACYVPMHVTPNSIEFGYASVYGGQVKGRWSRSGQGTWMRMYGSQQFGSWLRITNVTDNPESDFEEWKNTIFAEIGDDSDPNLKLKLSFVRP